MYLLYLMSSSGPDLAQVGSGQAWSVESSQTQACAVLLCMSKLLLITCLDSRVAVAGLALTINKFYGYDINAKDFSVSADFKVHFKELLNLKFNKTFYETTTNKPRQL